MILHPGFRAVAGSKFVAYLEPCSSTMWRPSGSDQPDKYIIMSDPEKGIFSDPVKYDKVPAITSAVPEKISITPNPFRSGFNLAISSLKEAKAQVVMYNARGMKVQQKSGLKLSQGTNNIRIDGTGLSSGIYLIEIFVDNKKTVKRVIKL